MVDDTVDFEQRYFLRMSNNPAALDLPGACAWYNRVCANGSLQALNREPRMTTFVKAIVKLIVTTEECIPPTFTFDYDRFQILRSDFRSCVYQAGCVQLFERLSRQDSWVEIPSRNCNILLKRIMSIVGPDMTTHSWARNASAVALEIVRGVDALRSFEGLPDKIMLEQTETSLRRLCAFDSAAYECIEDRLLHNLESLVKQQMEAVERLTPLQVLDYLNPGPCGSNSEEDNEPLLSIARRIAHMGVLHWRIWAPILYEQQHANHQSRPPLATTTVNLPKGVATSSGTNSGSLREELPRETAKDIEKADGTTEIFKQEGMDLEDGFFDNRSDQAEIVAELHSCSISMPKS